MPGIKIVVSTWKNEFNSELQGLIDDLVVTPDPGDSVFGRNWNRIVISSISGLSAVRTEFCIRSRVEVSLKEGIQPLENLLDTILNLQNENSIAYPKELTEAYLCKGLLFGVPDFLQIGKTSVLKDLWCESLGNSKFHMVSGFYNSMSSDQAICANYSYKFYGGTLKQNRFLLSIKNYGSFTRFLQRKAVFFDDELFGFDLGRLKRKAPKNVVNQQQVETGVYQFELRGLVFVSNYYFQILKRKCFKIYFRYE
jgi:hypothetical protein